MPSDIDESAASAITAAADAFSFHISSIFSFADYFRHGISCRHLRYFQLSPPPHFH